LAALLFLVSVVSFAEIKDDRKISEGKNGKLSETEKVKVLKESNLAKELARAKKYYFMGDLDYSEKCVDRVINFSEDNIRANELKNKILLLREKIFYLKKNIANDYLIELKRTVKDGNYYEGFLYLKKISSLMPNEDISSSYIRLSAERDLVESTIENQRDKKIFKKSIEYFRNEEFNKASKLIYKLYTKYPKFVDFVGMSRYYTVEEANAVRVENYYKQAVKNVKKHRFGKAKDFIELGYSLQPNNIKLRMLMEQINMEIM